MPVFPLIRNMLWSGLCIFAGAAGSAVAEDGESAALFTRRVEPIVREKCLACHGEDEEAREGGLDLRSLQKVAHGGDSENPGVVPMHPEQSSVYLAVTRSENAFSACMS